MACTITLTGIGYDCETNLSGVKAIYIADFNDVTDASVGTGEIVDSITMESGKKYMKYVPAKNTASMTNTLTKNDETGVKYYSNEIVANFNKMDTLKRIEMNQLDGGQLSTIVADKNGKFWLVGDPNEDYATATAVTGQTGAGPDDGNFFTLTVTGMSGKLPLEVAKSAVEAVVDEL